MNDDEIRADDERVDRMNEDHARGRDCGVSWARAHATKEQIRTIGRAVAEAVQFNRNPSYHDPARRPLHSIDAPPGESFDNDDFADGFLDGVSDVWMDSEEYQNEQTAED